MKTDEMTIGQLDDYLRARGLSAHVTYAGELYNVAITDYEEAARASSSVLEWAIREAIRIWDERSSVK